MISDWSSNTASAIIASVIGAVTWLVRRVLTNEKQIGLLTSALEHRDTLLKSDFAYRDALRKEDRQDVKDLKSDVKEIKSLLLNK